jgi:hypothetical protein
MFIKILKSKVHIQKTLGIWIKQLTKQTLKGGGFYMRDLRPSWALCKKVCILKPINYPHPTSRSYQQNRHIHIFT